MRYWLGFALYTFMGAAVAVGMVLSAHITGIVAPTFIGLSCGFIATQIFFGRHGTPQ